MFLFTQGMFLFTQGMFLFTQGMLVDTAECCWQDRDAIRTKECCCEPIKMNIAMVIYARSVWVGNKDLRLNYRFLLFRGKRFHFFLLHNF